MLGGIGSIGMSIAELGHLGYKLVTDSVPSFLARQKAVRLSYEALAQGVPDPTVGNDVTEEIRKIHELIGPDALLDVERRTVER